MKEIRLWTDRRLICKHQSTCLRLLSILVRHVQEKFFRPLKFVNLLNFSPK